MSAAVKLAWRYVHRKTRGGRERVPLTASELGEDQGVTTDAGRARIKTLRQARLLHLVDEDRSRGLYLVELLDPFDAFQAVRPTEYDPQRVLFDSDLEAELAPSAPPCDGTEDAPACLAIGMAAGEPPEEAPEDPPEEPRPPFAEHPLPPREVLARGTPSEPSEPSIGSVNKPSTIGSASEPLVRGSIAKDQARDPARGTSGGSSVDFEAEVRRRQAELGVKPPPAEPPQSNLTVALVQTLVREQHLEQQARTRERWVNILTDRVKDPGLYEVVKVRIATHLAAGSLDVQDVETVLRCLDKASIEGRIRESRGRYFVRSMQRVFRERGLHWPKPKPK